MREHRPFGITFIGFFYLFGAFVLLVSVSVNQEIPIGMRFGLSVYNENIVKITIAILSFFLSYGYLKMQKWGYWLMICYSAIFLLVSLGLVKSYNSQPFVGNALFSAIVLFYTITKRKLFLK